MSRFNKPVRAPVPQKARVCLFVNPDTYRRLKSQCVLDGTNISKWFDEQALYALNQRTLGFTESPRPHRTRRLMS